MTSNNTIVEVRFLSIDIPKLCEELGLDIDVIRKPVKYSEEYRIYPLTNKTNLLKFHTKRVKPEYRHSYIRHNYFIRGPLNQVQSILNRTCNRTDRGCFLVSSLKLDMSKVYKGDNS